MKPTKDGRPGRSGKAPRGYAKGGEIPNIEGMPRIQKTKVLKGTGPQDPSVGPTAAQVGRGGAGPPAGSTGPELEDTYRHGGPVRGGLARLARSGRCGT